LVIGGTGFIGYHTVQELLRRDYAVSVLSRNPDKHRGLFPNTVRYVQGDLDTLSVAQLADKLQPFDKLVFAAGVDERTEPGGDAWAFFHHANVDSVEKIFRAAQQSPLTHAVLLSSIFLQVHHRHPELKLAERHPYIRSRVEQHRISEALAKDHFVLTTLEIPWVFGTAPHLPSQWNSLITYVRSAAPLMACRGGANVVAVQTVAEAVYGALQYPVTSSTQVIGDLDVSYRQLVEYLCQYADRRQVQIREVKEDFFRQLMGAGGLFRQLFNIPAGLDIRYLPELLLRDIHVDHRESQALLRYSTGKAEQAIRETVHAAPEHRYLKGWRKLLNVFSRHSQ
jgi:dihydroflavonol-4-reductase